MSRPRRDLAATLDRAVRRREVSPDQVLAALQRVATDPKHPLMVSAARTLLGYLFGLPKARLEVEETRVDVAQILREIAEARRQRSVLAGRAPESNLELNTTLALPEPNPKQ